MRQNEYPVVMARNRSKMGRSESPDTAERHRKLNILDLSTELLQGITSKVRRSLTIRSFSNCEQVEFK